MRTYCTRREKSLAGAYEGSYESLCCLINWGLETSVLDVILGLLLQCECDRAQLGLWHAHARVATWEEFKPLGWTHGLFQLAGLVQQALD